MLDKSKLAKGIEDAYNSTLPGGDDFNKDADIKKKNKKIGKMMSDGIDDFLKSASVDISGIEFLPGTQVQTLPGQPVVNAPPIAGGVGATSGPGQAMTSAPCKQNPPTGIDCGKVY
jgi:hypothetical protein